MPAPGADAGAIPRGTAGCSPLDLGGSPRWSWRMLAPGTGPVQIAAIALIIIGKFGLPVLIVWFPFAAGWANFVLDSVDGDLLVPLGLPNENYQPVDKLADWATYVAMVVAAFRNGWPIRRLILGLFVFRSIGQVCFLLTGNELFLAAFPNFLEPLFLVTATMLVWQREVRHKVDWKDRAFALLARHKWLIGTLIVVYKLQDEYITHVGNIDRSDLLRQLLGG
jgi:hypothetical protein